MILIDHNLGVLLVRSRDTVAGEVVELDDGLSVFLIWMGLWLLGALLIGITETDRGFPFFKAWIVREGLPLAKLPAGLCW